MKLDDVKKLHQKKYRTRFGYYLVEGEHLILELHKAINGTVLAQKVTLYVSEQYMREEYTQTFKGMNIDFKVLVLTQKQMAQISDTKTPQGIVACVPLPNASSDQKPQVPVCDGSGSSFKNERCIYLYQVQDPGNLGTIIRSLAWFGRFRLILSPDSVDPFNPKVVRASMGAIFHLPIELDVSLDDLSTRFERFAYLDLTGSAVNSDAFAKYECYLFGNEARGVPHNALNMFNADAYTISGSGSIESLNLGSAVSMCAYQLSV